MSAGRTAPQLETLLTGLTEPQRQAVSHTDGPLLVLAGAGSGKTRVITRRAAYIAATAASPRDILAITFTNKAAREMLERIEDLGVGPGMTVCTFHSLCARILRANAEQAQIAPNFTIFDEMDRRSAVKEAVRACDADPTNWPAPKVVARISQAKNDLIGPAEFAEHCGRDFWARYVAKFYAAYEELMRRQQALDFDDLLMRTALLLRENEEVRAGLERRYPYLLIDEYQDTNDAQYLIAHLLSRDCCNICATGDPDQSIYGWRGANIMNILQFEQDHPGATVVRLEQNYRSTQRILSAASRMISANVQRKEKALWSENEQGRRVRVVEVADEDAEAAFIASEVEAAVRAGRSPRDFAVFYRINSLSLPVEMALRRLGLAYQVARGVEFFARKEIKDLLAYVRVLVNPADDTALKRIINTPPRGIGKTTIERLSAISEQSGRVLLDVVMDPKALQDVGRSGSRVAEFATLIADLRAALDLPAPEAVKVIFDRSGLHASLREEGTVDAVPLENVDALIREMRMQTQATPGLKLVEWLEQTSLASDVDSVEPGAESITLMTLHASKGLEFPVVFIVGAEEGLLPFYRQDKADTDLEEERRLCFVGMTRAQKELTLIYSRYRQRYGQKLRSVLSPFLRDLPASEIEWVEHEEGAPSSRPGKRSGSLPSDAALWERGTLVRHHRYGLGKVLSLQPAGGYTRIAVVFRDGRQEVFVLEHADLERVDFDEVDEYGIA